MRFLPWQLQPETVQVTLLLLQGEVGVHGSPGVTATSTLKVGSNESGTSIPHWYFPASSSLRLSKVTVKVRFSGRSLMDVRPLLTSLTDSVVSIIFHNNTHGNLHQYLELLMNSFRYRHSTLSDPPTVPVTLLGPLRDKQPGKHNRVQLHQVGLGQGQPGGHPQKFPHLTLAAPHQPENTLRVCPFHSVTPKTTAALSSRPQLSFFSPSHPSPTRDLPLPSLSGFPQPGAAQSPEEPLIGRCVPTKRVLTEAERGLPDGSQKHRPRLANFMHEKSSAHTHSLLTAFISSWALLQLAQLLVT